MGKSISKTWSEDQAERISYPRIWHDNWKTCVRTRVSERCGRWGTALAEEEVGGLGFLLLL